MNANIVLGSALIGSYYCCNCGITIFPNRLAELIQNSEGKIEPCNDKPYCPNCFNCGELMIYEESD